MGVGKSTLAAALADTLGMPRCCLDDIQWDYFEQWGFDHARAKHLLRSDSAQFLAYTNPYMARAAVRAIGDHPGCVIDFGAGHTAFDDAEQVKPLKAAFANLKHTFLLLPSPEPAFNESVLSGLSDGMTMNARFIRHPLQLELASHIIYTYGKSPEEITEEALACIF